MRLYLKTNGYGQSVIAKLKETRVKNNLYYEIKDRVLEETTDGKRIIRNKRKTKVYGLTSDKYVRDELIELLKERVRLHKDKFISPTIYEELRGMEVKKNGKVEHSDLTHDDQVFSYLMAIYVWYEGKNLRELFGIDKGPIKTEESVDDIVSLDSAEKFGDITQQLVALTKEGQDRIDKQMSEMQRAKGILLGDFVNKERKREEQNLKLLLQNPIVREAYARKYGMPADSVSIDTDVDTMAGRFYKVPDSLFFDFNKDESEMSRDSIYHSLNMKNLYSGNLEDNGLQ